MARRGKGRAVTGILLFDKPGGLTSNKALQRVRGLFQARKAGHTGSLDPLATGVLPICLGEATKVSGYLLDADKRYEVTARFGAVTDTGDADGEIVERRAPETLTGEAVAAAAAALTGEQDQVPPMYSAVRHQGRRLHELARQGREVERPARRVTVHRFELLALRAGEADLAVHCSKGTYVRALVEALGERLGPGAHVAALRRTAVAPFDPESPLIGIEALSARAEQGGPGSLDSWLLPMDSALTTWPAVSLDEQAATQLQDGQSVRVAGAASTGWTRVYDATGAFLGMGEVLDDGRLNPRRLLARAA